MYLLQIQISCLFHEIRYSKIQIIKKTVLIDIYYLFMFWSYVYTEYDE
jgi:hypothetical protein